MTKHTQGPYRYDRDNNAIYAGPDDVTVVYENGLQFESDGPLLAASWNMYDALNMAVNELRCIHSQYGDETNATDHSASLRAGINALAKAEGRL